MAANPRTTDVEVDPGTTLRMSRNRGRDTKPELAVRSLVHAMGLRYRVNARPIERLRRSADLVFRREHVAVMIDGCFWHGCPSHYRPATLRSKYWAEKRAENERRDRETDDALTEAGWLVLRFWEHEAPIAVAEQIKAVVLARRAGLYHELAARPPSS